MTDQPLQEISTERLLDEVISRSGGLTEMRKRLQDAVVGALLRGEPVDFLKDELRDGEKQKPSRGEKENERVS